MLGVDISYWGEGGHQSNHHTLLEKKKGKCGKVPVVWCIVSREMVQNCVLAPGRTSDSSHASYLLFSTLGTVFSISQEHMIS